MFAKVVPDSSIAIEISAKHIFRDLDSEPMTSLLNVQDIPLLHLAGEYLIPGLS